MSFGEQLRQRREELHISREELAGKVGVSRSAIGNYETGVSAPKEDVLLQLFDALQVDPNYLYQGSFRHGFSLSAEEQHLVEKYRDLPLAGRQAVSTVMDSLAAFQKELPRENTRNEKRVIPLYRSPAAAGFAAPVFLEDYEPLEVTGEVPPGAELAVRIQGDSMIPLIKDESVVYVNHDPLQNGDVGIFCVDGDMLCKQYYKDPLGIVYLFSLNRCRSDMDVVFPKDCDRSLVCFGRVMVRSQPLPVQNP